MNYYIVMYNMLNILPLVLNKKTILLRNTESNSGANSEVGNSLPLVDLVELKASNTVSGDESKKSSKDILGPNVKEIMSDVSNDVEDKNVKKVLSQKNENCWMSVNAKQHFQIMDNLNERYRKARSDYQEQLGEELDKKMLNTLLEWRGVAQREVFKTNGKPNLIPAGLNLGGYCMMKMKDSVLFFHRIKLRNQTHFRVNFLHTDVENMELVMRLSLNDLHLLGAYERSPVDKDPSVLFYAPTFGEVEFLLKNVDYKMEAQLRLLNNKLIIELVTSKLNIEDILMVYMNRADSSKPIRLIKENIDDFLNRMKTDLDKWLKDYFNDYLTYYGSLKTPSSEFTKAENDKIIALNDYADSSLNIIRDRLRYLGADNVKIPHFTIFGPDQMKLQLNDGSLRGLDSIYRRSVTTAKKENDIRKVNLIVGFSNLKVMYKYEASLRMGVPPLAGIIVLSADELTAHMELSLVKDPETFDLEFDYIQQMKPESLTVEGPASRMIANFKHLLEHHIIAIMSNAVTHNIKMLRTLSRCEPMLLSQHKSNKFRSFSKMNANGAIPKEQESDIDIQKAQISQSDSDNNKSSIVKQSYLNPSDIYISDMLSEGMPSSGIDELPSEIIVDASDNLFPNEENVSKDSNIPNKSDDINSTNSSKSTEDDNYSQKDDELNSELENKEPENGSVHKNSDKTTPHADSFNKTKHPNIEHGFILSRNDSVELELSDADNFKGGKYKLTREEKMKLTKLKNNKKY